MANAYAIDPGRLDTRIEVLRPVTSRDAYGQEVATWQTAGTIWGALTWVRDGERWAARRVGEDAVARVIVRGVPVGLEDRLRIDGVDYSVIGVKRGARNAWSEITISRAET